MFQYPWRPPQRTPVSLSLVPYVANGMPHGTNHLPSPSPLATYLPHDLLSLPRHAIEFVPFPLDSLERALKADLVSNTWHARVRRPPSKPTGLPRMLYFARDLTSRPLTVWRSPISSYCPFYFVQARRVPWPDSVRHVVAEHDRLHDKEHPDSPLTRPTPNTPQ
jgi:hypothetical protein